MMGNILETENLIIRHFSTDDVDALSEILGDPKVMEFSTNGPYSKEETKSFIKQCLSEYEHPGFSLWAVIHKYDAKLIGYCGIRPEEIDDRKEVELGYRLAYQYWGQGLGTEAAKACRDYAFNKFGLTHLVSIIEAKNTRSLGIADNLDMFYEKNSVYHGIPVLIYRVNRPEIVL